MRVPSSIILEKHRIADALAEANHGATAEQVRACAEKKELVFCQSCGKTWYITVACRQRICPVCSFKTAIERAEALIAICKQMKFPKFVTLTIARWKAAPRDGIKFLRQSFNALRETDLFALCRGGAYQIELKRKDDGWHIHLHAILDAPYIPYQRLFSEWTTIVGQDYAAVWIQAAGNDKQIAYVCKYSSKASGFEGEPDDAVAWYEAVKGSRLFTTFGTFYNIDIDELLDQVEDPEDAPKCPHCGKQHTCIRARDGPAVYGHKDWDEIKDSIMEGNELYIDNKDLQILSSADVEAIRAERKAQRGEDEHPKLPLLEK